MVTSWQKLPSWSTEKSQLGGRKGTDFSKNSFKNNIAKQSKSVEVFKTKLKTLLFKEYYKKGVCG